MAEKNQPQDAKVSPPEQQPIAPGDMPMTLQDFANHHKSDNEVEIMAGFVVFCLKNGFLHSTEKEFLAKYEEFKKMPV